MFVDEGVEMIFRRRKEVVEFYDRCGSVCDSACRSRRHREQLLDRMNERGLRV
jgi:hypothetical protein